MSKITLMRGDCLDKMQSIADHSIDLILTDPPYGTTACKWDNIIPFDQMWNCLLRIIKKDCAIVLFGNEPFSSKLRVSNLDDYKYDWVWDKVAFSNQMMAKKQPLRVIENIMVFNTNRYYPQNLIRCNKVTKQGSKVTDNIGGGTRKTEYIQEFTNYPKNLVQFSKDRPSVHPTQKPVALMEYLIKTYTQEGETVLDFTAGSFTTAIAAINTKRAFIGIEKDDKYFNLGAERVKKHIEIKKESDRSQTPL